MTTPVAGTTIFDLDIRLVPGQTGPDLDFEFFTLTGEPATIPDGTWTMVGGVGYGDPIPLVEDGETLVASFPSSLTAALVNHPWRIRCDDMDVGGGQVLSARPGSIAGQLTVPLTVTPGTTLALRATVTPAGPPGPGMPTGGTEGQVPRRTDGPEFEVAWGDAPTSAEMATAIGVEADRATAAEGVLTGALAAEVAARGDADTTLATAIAAEATARAAHEEETTGAHGGLVAADDARLVPGLAGTPTVRAVSHHPVDLAVAPAWMTPGVRRALETPGLIAGYHPGHYVEGESGDPGRYPNLAPTGAELDLLEPASAGLRPDRDGDLAIVTFDGDDDYLYVPDDARLDLDEGTAIVLVRWVDPADNAWIISKTDGGSNGWDIVGGPTGAASARWFESSGIADAVPGPPGSVDAGLRCLVGRRDAVDTGLVIDGLRHRVASEHTLTPHAGPLIVGALTTAGEGPASMELIAGPFFYDQALSLSEIESITNGLLARPDIQAERIEIDPFLPPLARAGFDSSSPLVGLYGGGYQSSTADGQWIEWAVNLSPGTWGLGVLHTKFSNSAILDVSLDGVSVGAIDGYDPGVLANVITVVVFSVASPGRKTLRLTVDGRNPANTTGWTAGLQRLSLTRTDGT